MVPKSLRKFVLYIVLFPILSFAQNAILTAGIGTDGTIGKHIKQLNFALNTHSNLFWVPYKSLAIGGMAAYHYVGVDDYNFVNNKPILEINHIIDIEPSFRILLNATNDFGLFLQAGVWWGWWFTKNDIKQELSFICFGGGLSIYKFEVFTIFRGFEQTLDNYLWSINVGYNFARKK
jgi:hypothetical protein